MYYTYVLVSLKNGDIYVGSAENYKERLSRHSQGRVKSTKGYRPWRVLELKEFETRSEAVRFERLLKTHRQKEILKKKYESA